MNLCLYIPGGWVADKYSAKWVIVLSLFGTGVLNFVFAMHMTYNTAMIVWVLLAFTTAFAFWSGVIKAIRLLGSAKEQGRLYGFFSSGVGLFSAAVSGLGLLVYGLYAADQVAGLKGVIYVQGAACVISSIIVLFFYAESDEGEAQSEDDKFQTRDILKVLREPMTWVISLLIFCGHGIYTSTSYFNPYMTNVIGVTMAFSGVLAIVRTHLLRLTCGPLGGILADRVKSPGAGAYLLLYGHGRPAGGLHAHSRGHQRRGGHRPPAPPGGRDLHRVFHSVFLHRGSGRAAQAHRNHRGHRLHARISAGHDL